MIKHSIFLNKSRWQVDGYLFDWKVDQATHTGEDIACRVEDKW